MGGLLLPEVMPVAATDQSSGLIADGKPCLGTLSRIEVDWGARAAHPGARPARIDGIAQDAGPAPRQGEGQRGDVKLALGIGCGWVPAPSGPVEVVQRPLAR